MYRKSKKQLQILCSKLLYRLGNYFLDIQYLHFGHVAEDAEDDEAGDEAGEAVDRAGDDRILKFGVTDPG